MPADPTDVRPPMFQPFRLRGLELKNRVVVSPMDMYVAVDGMPNDFHLVHLGGKALGGAGLVMTEMVCVSETGRITPGCTGLYEPEHETAYRRIVDFVHDFSTAKIGLQLGHSGRKGSTKLMWEGIDEPLPAGNWPVVAPSPLPYRPGVNQVPRELTRRRAGRDPRAVRAVRRDGAPGRVRPARAALRARLPAVELHLAADQPAHRRVRRVPGQPAALPARGLRRAARGVAGGQADDACASRRPTGSRAASTPRTPSRSPGRSREHGADAIDVSTGQVTPDERPAFGRSYQTPYADRIRNQVGIPTIAVGAISSYDDVNSHHPGRPRRPVRRSGARTSTTRTGPCTRLPSRATRAPRRSGRTRSRPAADPRRRGAPTARDRGCS